MKSFLYTLLLCLVVTISPCIGTEKIYLDEKEIDMSSGSIHIHVGDNQWIQAKDIHGDEHGIFMIDKEIIQEKDSTKAYERTWKCPYCYRHWPIGKKCQNPDCPSKYM